MNEKRQDMNRSRCGRKTILAPKQILFRQGACARKCFFIRKGHLKLTQLNGKGRQVIVQYMDSGGFTGVVPVLDRAEYPATAEAVSVTEVVAWDRADITRLMERTPDIVVNALHTTERQLEGLRNRYVELCGDATAQRIARAVLEFCRRAGSKTRHGVRIDIPLSRQNIADYIGSTVHTVSRELSAWEKSGWIRSGREKITVTAPDMLGRIAGHGK